MSAREVERVAEVGVDVWRVTLGVPRPSNEDLAVAAARNAAWEDEGWLVGAEAWAFGRQRALRPRKAVR